MTATDGELLDAAADFADAFELVFDNDWEMTKGALAHPAYMIEPDGTFLNPRVDDESNNWANRGSLLASYRRLRALLTERGIPSQFE